MKRIQRSLAGASRAATPCLIAFVATTVVSIAVTRAAPALAAANDEARPLHVTSEGAGPAVVVVPWFSGGAYAFRRITPRLVEAGCRVVVVEPLGVGASPRPAKADYSLDAQSDRVIAELDRLGVSHAVLVGHGLSASIALRVALRRPELAASIVSLEGGPAESPSTPGLRRAMKFAAVAKIFVTKGKIRKRIRDMMLRASADPAWVNDETVAGYAASATSDAKRTIDVLSALAKSEERAPLAPRLPSLACPVELLVGAAPHEGGVPEAEIAALRDSLPSFLLTSVPRAGHFIQEERPDAVLEAIARAVRNAPHATDPAVAAIPAAATASH